MKCHCNFDILQEHRAHLFRFLGTERQTRGLELFRRLRLRTFEGTEDFQRMMRGRGIDANEQRMLIRAIAGYTMTLLHLGQAGRYEAMET